MRVITKTIFEGEVVPLDDMHYIDCEFVRCELAGSSKAKWKMTNCSVESSVFVKDEAKAQPPKPPRSKLDILRNT
jgi:hypothetical protein